MGWEIAIRSCQLKRPISDAGAKRRAEDSVDPINCKLSSKTGRLDRDSSGKRYVEALAPLSCMNLGE